MTALLYISISVFCLYLTGIILYRGIPDSISESYYVLGENKLISSLFTWFCWLTAITLLPYWLDNGGGFLSFVACGALVFVGTAPMFKSHQKTIHFGSAMVCFLSAYIWLLLNNLTLAVISVAVLVAFSFVKKRMFWWEVTAFASIYLTLILRGVTA
jgi:hypothetical protein